MAIYPTEYDVRFAFEKNYILANGLDADRTDEGEYRDSKTECAWLAWIACFYMYSPIPKIPVKI